MFEQITAISRRGNQVNEDFVFANSGLLLVIDGSSGLTKSLVMDEYGSDARWFSHRVGALLAEGLTPDRPIPVCLREILAPLRAEFDARCAQLEASPAYPSAAITLLRAVPGGLEYFALGDCTTLLEHPSGDVELLRDPAVSALDGTVVAALRGLIPTLGVAAAREAVRPQLLKNRRRMNRPDGYGVLEPTGQGLPMAITRLIPTGTITCACLMTDGFADLFFTFHRAETPEAFLCLISQATPQALVDTLFALQDADPDLQAHPRLKLRDDTTMVSATLTPLPPA